MTTYETLTHATVEAAPLIKSHVTLILKKIKGKLNTKRNLRNPYSFKLDFYFYHLLFITIFRAIRDYRKDDGTTLPLDVNVTRNKRTNIPTGYTITIYSLYAFHLHFTKLTLHAFNITTFTEKTIRKNKVRLAISPEKPFIMHFKPSTETLKITGCYEVINQYGELCSYYFFFFYSIFSLFIVD